MLILFSRYSGRAAATDNLFSGARVSSGDGDGESVTPDCGNTSS